MLTIIERKRGPGGGEKEGSSADVGWTTTTTVGAFIYISILYLFFLECLCGLFQ